MDAGRGMLRRRWVGLLLVAAVLVTGAIVTAGLSAAVEAGEDRYAGQVMDRYADDITAAITDRVGRYGETLHDLAYAIGAQSELRAEDFDRIVAGLSDARLPGVGAVGFLVPADPGEVAAVQRQWRLAGATGLTLRPAPGVDHHAFAIFERSFAGAAGMAGTDLERSPEAAMALHTARQTDLLTISAAYQLLRDSDVAPEARQTSVVLAVPVYSGRGSADPDRFVGWTVMGVRGQDFLSQTLLDRGQGAVQVTLSDPAAGGTLIAAVSPGDRVDDSDLRRDRALSVGQRRWQVTMWPSEALLASTDRGMSRLTLGACAALTLLLALLTVILSSSRNRALDRVDRATAALRRDIDRREVVEARLRESEQQLRHLAFHDPLTGLANRLLFYDRLSHAIATHARGNRTFAVLFIDLDGFKQINDGLGHAAGDRVLTEVATRLRTGLRIGDTVARFGGDEFAMIIESLNAAEDARIAAARIVDAVQQPIDIDGTPAMVSASIGIAVNRPEAAADDILREADAAMYAAKTGGKSRYVEA